MDKLRNIRRHHWKERLKIGKLGKFESDLSKTNEDIAPQRSEILQTFVWRGGGGGGGHILATNHTNVCKFSQLCTAISSLAKDVSLSNLAVLLILRRSFQW